MRHLLWNVVRESMVIIFGEFWTYKTTGSLAILSLTCFSSLCDQDLTAVLRVIMCEMSQLRTARSLSVVSP